MVSRWIGMGMVFTIIALIVSALSFAPIAAADDTSTTTTTTPPTPTESAKPSADEAPTESSAPTTTTTPSATESPTATESSTADEKPTSTTPSADEPAATTTPSEPTSQKREASPRAGGINDRIVVEITEIKVEGGSDDQQVQVGDSVEVHGTWDATAADPQPGDQFSIRFPDQLRLGGTVDFDLLGEDGTSWGTCSVDPASNVMLCTLSDAVAENPEDVHGTFYVYAKATEYTDAEDLNFLINGKVTVPGQLPGGGIGDGADLGDAKKTGVLSPDKVAVRWTIDIPGGQLAQLDPSGDGKVTLTDNLSDNMELCESPRLNATLQSGRPGALKPVDGGVNVTQAGGAGQPVTIAVDNGEAFDKNKLYRIEYTSCTSSGTVDLPVDGENTVYTNSVTVGENTVGGEVGQGWEPATEPSKSGSLGSGGRYQELSWTIMVPGSFIAETGPTITIDETLTGGHEVCDGGLKVQVQRANHLPDANNQNPRENVTAKFAISTAADAGATEFSLVLTPEAGYEIDEGSYYYVRFVTCLTDEGVPDLDRVFTNTATVNGAEVEKNVTVKVPEFHGKKIGKLNQEPVEIAGETQPAGTTVGWTAEIPGYDLEGLDEPAVIDDVFSDTLTVCEVGDDLKSNLNLTVTARDFLGNDSVHAERDLTAATSVVRTDSGLQFTLPKEEGDYNRETRYIIDYTLCTSSGGLDERGTVYENTIEYAGKELTQGVTQEWGGGGTGTGVSRGSFSLVKEIHSFSEEFPTDTEFTVQVDEYAPGVDPVDGEPAESYTVKVKADGTPVSGFYPRGNGWTIKLSEIDLPEVDGVYFEQGTFRPSEGVTVSEDGTVAFVTITPKSNVGVQLTNRAHLGSVTVDKIVTGDGVAGLTGNERFVIDAEMKTTSDAKPVALPPITLKDGQEFPLKDLPIGAEITFSEVRPVDTNLVTWAKPVIEPETLIVGKDSGATVTVTNEAQITQGTFSLAKKLTGPEAYNPAVPEGFDVVATWVDANGAEQSKTLTLPADGTEVPFGEDLPGGTEVTVTEVVPADGSGLAWGAPAYTGDVVIDESGSAVVTIGKDPGTVKVKNYVDTNDGTLRIVKQVSGEAAEAVGDDAEFTVEARWKDGTEYRTEELTVRQGEATDLGVDLPVGTEVTFTETARADIAGVEWGTITWGTDPAGESWLISDDGGSATGIVSDDPTEGRLITLTNEARWEFGAVGFEKFIVDGEDTVPATEADLPDGTRFEVQIDGIDPALPEGTDFPAVGETIVLDASNDWRWQSEQVLPRGTVITFSEVDPEAVPGMDWGRPYYYVTADAGEADYRDTVEIVGGEDAAVEIHNRPIPTTDVDIDKVVTGPKGDQVTKDDSTIFQVTATWTDIDDVDRTCVLDVTPGGSATPTAQCDAPVIDGRVQFPVDTEITFVETGAYTDVTNVKWGEVTWTVNDGKAELTESEGQQTGVVVVFPETSDQSVVLGLKNETSSKGLIIIPLPIPLPPWGGGTHPPTPGPDTPGPVDPGPDAPGSGQGTGHEGAPGKPAPEKPGSAPQSSGSGSLAVTGADVVWMTVAALVLILGGGWLALRGRRKTGEA